jgi:hypothetical protein
LERALLTFAGFADKNYLLTTDQTTLLLISLYF